MQPLTRPAIISMVDNVSVEPFRLVRPPFPSILRSGAPSATWKETLAGEVDLAVVSVAKLPEVSNVMEPTGEFGVACTGPVGSVLLFSRHAVVDLVRQRRPVHLTADSETSRRLFQWLCVREFGVEPAVTPHLADAVARLCIGDEALRECLDPKAWPVAADLCGWWQAQTRRPFVFARWMVRRSATSTFKTEARDWLASCVESARSLAGRQALVKRGLQAGLFSDHASAGRYFERLRSKLSDDDQAAERLFLESIAIETKEG